MTMLFLIINLMLISISGYSIESRNLTSAQKDQIKYTKDIVTELFKNTYKEGCSQNKHRLGTPTSRTEMDKGMVEILNGLYTGGFFRNSSEIQTWIDKYFNLRAQNTSNYKRIRWNDKDGDTDYHDGSIPSGCNRKSRWKKLYINFANDVVNFLKNRKIECANSGDIATVKQCCDFNENNPLSPQQLPYIGYEAPTGANACGIVGKSCTKHTECCSGQCMLNDEVTPIKGTCAPVLSCYIKIQKDLECHPITKPYCLTPWNTGGWNNKQFDVMCVPINHESVGIGECKQLTQACTNNTECCSDKCVSGSCDFNAKCTACLNNGEPYVESDGIPCCPGHYPGMGDNPKCLPKFPPLILPSAKIKKPSQSIFQKIFNLIIPSAHATSSCNFLNETQMGTIQSMTEDCFNQAQEGDDGINTCLKTVTVLKEGYKVTNFTTEKAALDTAISECGSDTACRDEAREEFHQKCQTYSMSRMSHAATYNIPTLQSKTFSNLDTCQFNNLNDNWAEASNSEKNAELVVRAFEYLFSGGGAQDYWVQAGRDGKNIFKRSKNVATLIKRIRRDYRAKQRKKDVLMMCKCVLSKKGEKLPAEVLSFFNIAPECEGEKDALDKMMTNKEVSNSVGATGISHEVFLVSYAQIKKEAAIDEFFDYTAINTELDQLVKYLNGDEATSADWYKADRGYEKLYTFKVKWMSKWFKIFLIVVAVAIVMTGIILTGGALGAGLGSAMASLGSTVGMGLGIGAFTFTSAASLGITTVMLAGALVGAGISALFKNRIAKPKLRDVVVESDDNAGAYNEEKEEYVWSKGKKWNWLRTHAYFKIDRYYDFPYYYDANSGCDIMAPANMCVRNMFLTVSDYGLSYLTDAKKPLYVPDYTYPDDINYVGMINGSHQYLITKLKMTNPGSVTKRKFLKRDILSEPDIQNAMMPLNGSFVPGAFDENKAMKVLNGAKTFAKCKEITGDKAITECKVTIGEHDVEEGDIGFGYFFESQQDIDDFAAYFYQHHFHWPSLTASGQIGYPLLGQNIYYQTILHNIRIIMAGAKDRTDKFGQLYDLYKSDWDKRIRDYNCTQGTTGGDSAVCAVINAGGFSKNVKYSNAFVSNFRRLNFNIGVVGDVEVTGSSDINIGGSGSSMSASEVALLENAKKQALKNALQIKKSDHYKKVVGNTPRGKQIQNAFNKWNKKFSQPMSAMTMKKGGKSWGGASSTTNTTNNYQDTKKQLDNKFKINTNTKSQYSNSYNNYSSKNYSGYSSGSNPSESSKLPVISRTKPEKTKADLLAEKKAFYGFGERDENDSLFEIVSKAYSRNLDKFIDRKSLESTQLETKKQNQ